MARASSASGAICERRVGLLDRFGRVGVLQREVGQQLVGFDQLRIELERLVGVLARLAVEAVGARRARGRDRRRRSSVALQRFVEQLGRVGVVEALVEQAAPADAVVRVAVGARHRGPEFVVGVLVQLEAPVAFGAQVRIGGQRQRLVAGRAPRARRP